MLSVPRNNPTAACVMGIVNVTPDSFDAETRTFSQQQAVQRGLQLAAQGAAIIDVGGESTRPGAASVGRAEELRRVLPVVQELAQQLEPNVKISIDTMHAEVAEKAVGQGATIINDMSATLGPLAGALKVSYVAAHMPAPAAVMQAHACYENVVGQVLQQVCEAAQNAADLGATKVWIDPGLGFGKTFEHNLELVAHIDRFIDSGFPVLVGVSRKSTIGLLHAKSDASIDRRRKQTSPASQRKDMPLDNRDRLEAELEPTPSHDRLEGSLAVACWCFDRGVEVLRVHDVAETVDVLKLVSQKQQILT